MPASLRGTSSAALLAICDWYATFCALGGLGASACADAPGSGVPPSDSIDFWPVVVSSAQGPAITAARSEVISAPPWRNRSVTAHRLLSWVRYRLRSVMRKPNATHPAASATQRSLLRRMAAFGRWSTAHRVVSAGGRRQLTQTLHRAVCTTAAVLRAASLTSMLIQRSTRTSQLCDRSSLTC